MTLPGSINGNAAGILMKEMVRRAIFAIRRQFDTFEASEKVGLDNREDFVTTADRAAQDIYMKILTECFPNYGIVAEEDKFSLECSIPGESLFFTVDPLDGTKAFMRRQSHAIGTMISLVRDGQVIGAYVGDVMTHEIYGFRPGSDSVWRTTEYNASVRLVPNPTPLRRSDVSLRNEPASYSEAMRKVACGRQYGGAFRGMQVAGGSIGIDVARLWKGEIGALVLEPFFNTPWDYCPVMGISQRLGYAQIEVVNGSPKVIEPAYSMQGTQRKNECILVHSSHVPEMLAAFE